jgi:hypothetical protein
MSPSKKIIGILVLLVLCVLMDIEFSSGYIGFFTLISIILLIGFIYLVAGLFHNKKRLLKGGSIIVFCIVEILISNAIIKYQRQMTYGVGEKVIKAIEQYQITNDNYPKHINDLTPVFIGNIPNTHMGWYGRPFKYTATEEKYRLSFDYHVFLTCSYDEETTNWYCDD